MNAYSEADAKRHLSELIDGVLRGESVIIMRDGKAAVELRPIAQRPQRVSAAALDWLAERRVGAKRPHEDAGALVSRMRDESEG